MALSDRLLTDIHRVFMNPKHFAETHYWDGQKIICVPDEEMALKRKNNNVNDISWQENQTDVTINTPIDGFPCKPIPNTHIIFDKRHMKVMSVETAIGMYIISLNALEAREM